MYKADGVELTETEYQELVTLCSMKSGFEEYSARRIKEDRMMLHVYRHLHKYRLITGYRSDDWYRMIGVTVYGTDWLKSYRKSVEDARKATARERRYLILNTILGAVAGGIVSIIAHLAVGA